MRMPLWQPTDDTPRPRVNEMFKEKCNELRIKLPATHAGPPQRDA